VITPFPGGVVRAAAKSARDGTNMIATTNDAFVRRCGPSRQQLFPKG
jgi:formylmethanofuran:tetrahydromethanopterin formyltransferase